MQGNPLTGDYPTTQVGLPQHQSNPTCLVNTSCKKEKNVRVLGQPSCQGNSSKRVTLPPCKRGLRAIEISKSHLYASERQSPKTWIIGDNQPGWGNVCALFDWNDLPSWRQFVSIFVINVKSPPHALPPRPPSRLHKEQKIDAPIVTNKDGLAACICKQINL